MRDLIKVGCLVLVLCLSLAAPVAAGPFEDGVAAYNRGDYATALRVWRPLAEQGEAVAQFHLGLLYASGHGVPQDYAEAMTWYRKAAEQGSASAQSGLGFMYASGHGVPQDYAEAVTLYRKAAELGHPVAQNNLGAMYEFGHGVPQDYVQAHKWYNLAAARFSGERRQDADGVVKTGEHEEAVGNRDRVAAKMTAAQIAEAQRLAREWKPR